MINADEIVNALPEAKIERCFFRAARELGVAATEADPTELQEQLDALDPHELAQAFERHLCEAAAESVIQKAAKHALAEPIGVDDDGYVVHRLTDA